MALSEYKMKQLCRCVGCHKSGMTEKKHGSSCCFTPNVTFKTKNINVTQYESTESSQKILPVYPETEGLTSKYLRKLILPIILIWLSFTVIRQIN